MTSLGHVNIRTQDLDASVCFYRDVIGLRPGPAATRPTSADHVWMHDDAGSPCIHLQRALTAQGCDANDGPGVHHVALNCTGPEGWREKLAALGVPFREMSFEAAKLLQFNLEDPDGVRLEMLFAQP